MTAQIVVAGFIYLWRFGDASPLRCTTYSMGVVNGLFQLLGTPLLNMVRLI